MCSPKPIYVFCSANRPEMLHESVLCAVRQTVPGRILVSVPGIEHICPKTQALPGVEVVLSAQGSSTQRNAAIQKIDDYDTVIFFFDDDVEIEEHYSERIRNAYQANPGIALMNGKNLGRGAAPGSLSRESARELIREHVNACISIPALEPARSAFGCRMSFPGRLLGKVWFDERLALYGYQEDYEFSLKCAEFGGVATNRNAWMVHIETPAGRVGLKQRGYSEVVNPVYIASKHKRANKARALAGAVRRTARNAMRAYEQGARQRFVGNLLGWTNIASGSFRPERVTALKGA